jgi:hypothetical protein
MDIQRASAVWPRAAFAQSLMLCFKSSYSGMAKFIDKPKDATSKNLIMRFGSTMARR